MTTTDHIVTFTAAHTDWQAGVTFDGAGFSVEWVSILDSTVDFNGKALDEVGCYAQGRVISCMNSDGERYMHHSHGVWRTLRSLALAAAESDRDRIAWRHAEEITDSAVDHAQARNEAAS